MHRIFLLVELFLEFLDLTPQRLVLESVPVYFKLSGIQSASFFVVPLGQLLDLAFSQE